MDYVLRKWVLISLSLKVFIYGDPLSFRLVSLFFEILLELLFYYFSPFEKKNVSFLHFSCSPCAIFFFSNVALHILGNAFLTFISLEVGSLYSFLYLILKPLYFITTTTKRNCILASFP